MFLMIPRWLSSPLDLGGHIETTMLQVIFRWYPTGGFDTWREGLASTQPPVFYLSRDGISSGCLATLTPAVSRARTLSAAVPAPPSMIAPACPMRLPGGAV